MILKTSIFLLSTLLALVLVLTTFHKQVKPMQTSTITSQEAADLLLVLSKLDHVTIVQPSQYMETVFPHICWVDTKPFHVLTGVLARYPGSFQWGTFVNLPRRCLVIEPNVRKGESPFIIPTKGVAYPPGEATEMANRLEKLGIHVPWRNSPYVEAADFKIRVLREIPKVAEFIEKELALTGRASFGVESSSDNLDLPLIEDRSGPGSGVVLVSDPERYALERSATSRNDRAIHYWITENESAELLTEISRFHIQGSSRQWPLLSRAIGNQYESQIVLPQEVPILASEAALLRNRVGNISEREALDRISSVCRSARAYGLGIYIPANSG